MPVSCSARLRRQNVRRSSAIPTNGAPSAPSSAEATNSWRNSGIAARALGPRSARSTSVGTSRQPSTRRFSSAASFSIRATAAAAFAVVRGQERGADRVRPGGRQREVDHGTQELVRNLDQDADAVPGVVLGAARAAVLEPQQRRETPADDRMVAAAGEVRHQGDTARVVLVLGRTARSTYRRSRQRLGCWQTGRSWQPRVPPVVSVHPDACIGTTWLFVRSVGCTRCTDQLVRSGNPACRMLRTGELLPDGRWSVREALCRASVGLGTGPTARSAASGFRAHQRRTRWRDNASARRVSDVTLRRGTHPWDTCRGGGARGRPPERPCTRYPVRRCPARCRVGAWWSHRTYAPCSPTSRASGRSSRWPRTSRRPGSAG